MQPSLDAALLDALDRHAQRRAQGIATLSTLVGPPERALSVWTEWIQRRGSSVVVVDGDDLRAVVSAWAAALARDRNLSKDAEAFVLRTQPMDKGRVPRFHGKTAHERRVLLEGLTPPHAHAATWQLCQAILEAPVGAPPGVLPEAVGKAIDRAPLEALQALLALAPEGSTPALRVRAGPSDFRPLRAAAALCAAAPALTAGCVLAPEAIDEHLRRGESHVLAMLREGRLDLAQAVVELPVTVGGSVASTRARLRQEGASEKVVSLYDAAARTIASAYRDADGRARSEAEKFLHARLQEHPATRGLFILNGRLDPGNGGRPLEVDLLCSELRLAVEIDGYFHFRNPDGFRRDRRKDVALQCAGYWVVRFLADDVVDRLEEILETLDTLIATRRGELTGKDAPHGKR
ncbi:endonuclease domain-containing protein [Myxococcus sp. Y35]|uniref:endonuclease domain-containing protein n=1 Tax=Pseudomyxococcus flavus TaxID=3115648 RepID=UPI003CE745F5